MSHVNIELFIPIFFNYICDIPLTTHFYALFFFIQRSNVIPGECKLLRLLVKCCKICLNNFAVVRKKSLHLTAL